MARADLRIALCEVWAGEAPEAAAIGREVSAAELRQAVRADATAVARTHRDPRARRWARAVLLRVGCGDRDRP